MNVAIAHDWLTGMRGGERVLETLLEVWPGATVYTLFHERGKVSPAIEAHPIVVSWLDRLPGIYRHYRNLLPLFPAAIETLDVGRRDLVISSSHAVAKGIRAQGAMHISYCHTPMRYIWDAEAEYAPNMARRIGLSLFRKRLREWDRSSAAGVDHFIANSKFVADRIQSYYGRNATIIHPPVDTEFFRPPRDPSDFFLSAGALVGYKRVDLVVDAFNQSGRRLVVAGTGPEERSLRKKAGPRIEFRGNVSTDDLRTLYRQARALVFAAREDFGIVPVEARCCGCPVIAFAGGGAVESLEDGHNGIIFSDRSVDGLNTAIERFEGIQWSATRIQENTAEFGRERFKAETRTFVEAQLDEVDGVIGKSNP